MPRITFQKATVKELEQRLSQAVQAGDLRLVRRLSVLRGIARGERLTKLASLWRVNRQTIYNWLKSCVEQRWESLTYSKPAGRPSHLTKLH